MGNRYQVVSAKDQFALEEQLNFIHRTNSHMRVVSVVWHPSYEHELGDLKTIVRQPAGFVTVWERTENADRT